MQLTLDKPFYWGDEPNIIELGTQLFNVYSPIYQPEKSKIIRFAETEMNESENNEFLRYFMSDGEIGIYDILYYSYFPLEPGDIIEVTTGTFVFIQPRDSRWHAARGIIDVKAVSKTD